MGMEGGENRRDPRHDARAAVQKWLKKKKKKKIKDTLLQFTELHQTQKKKGNGFNNLRILQHTHAYYIYVHYIYMDI